MSVTSVSHLAFAFAAAAARCERLLKTIVIASAMALTAMSGAQAQGKAQAAAQVTPKQLAILRAEDHRAVTAEELATIRDGLRDADARTVRIAVRALGRLERPVVIADILPLLSHRDPAVGAEAATAIGQAAQGWKRDPPAGWERQLDAAQAALAARLVGKPDERDPAARAAVCDSIGRLPYSTPAQVDIAERALVGAAPHAAAARGATDGGAAGATPGSSMGERFAATVGLFRLTRFRALHPLGAEARALLAAQIAVQGGADAVRVRRLAFEAYLALGPLGSGGEAERALIEKASHDADAQVRRLAVRIAAGAANHEGAAIVKAAVADSSLLVRMEALRGLVPGGVPIEEACGVLVKALDDRATPVVLMALDELSRCGASAEAVQAMVRAADDMSSASAASAGSRSWHRAAHALTSLATAAPDRAGALLAKFKAAPIWQVRMYAARAAMTLKDRGTLEALASDADDNVREVAIDALVKLYGHDADAIFLAQFTRKGNQALRSAALALVGTPRVDEARTALRALQQRLIAEGRDNSHDARTAIAKALESFGDRASTANTSATLADSLRLSAVSSDLDDPNAAATLQRLTGARARITMRGVGVFELTLLPAEAPATVLRFARLAKSGYYNGLTFHRVVPNFVIQGGSPDANEYVGDATFMRDEVGTLPHVRGAAGISTRGRDTGDAQIFVNHVDIPRLDHEFTVFAETSSGLDVIDQILEGDVIERIDIITGSVRRTP